VTDQGEVFRREGRSLGELAALYRDPLFYGRGVPRGDRRLVVVVPGLFGNDLYTQPLRNWLARIGYTPVRSALLVNAGCPDRLRNEVERSLRPRLERSQGPISLIGHSRGGMLCWALASKLQDRVSHVVLLGSPAPAVVAMMKSAATSPDGIAAPGVAGAGARALRLLDPDCTVPACGCAYTDDLRRSLHPRTSVLSIYSRDDPIVRPEACRLPDGENIEVEGSHSGLAHNRTAFGHIGAFLART
jgi:pimeloyl-ACP methyl ester carboxylesterase